MPPTRAPTTLRFFDACRFDAGRFRRRQLPRHAGQKAASSLTFAWHRFYTCIATRVPTRGGADHELQSNTAEIAVASDADVRSKHRKTRLLTIDHLDGRTVASRRARALAEAFTAALGGNLTPAQQHAVETAAALSALAEDCQSRRLAGDDSVNLDDTVRVISAARRARRDLGIDDAPTSKPAAPAAASSSMPSIAEMLRRRDRERAQQR